MQKEVRCGFLAKGRFGIIINKSKKFREQIKKDVAFVCNNSEAFGIDRKCIKMREVADLTGYSKGYVELAFMSLRRARKV